MLVKTLPPPAKPVVVTATPLTREAFAAFGDVVANPRPAGASPPRSASASAGGELPYGAVAANQGTAVQYRAIGPSTRDLYGGAPSGRPGTPRITMFVCAARTLVSVPRMTKEEGETETETEMEMETGGVGIEVRVLERHPFTSQTFVPLAVNPDGPAGYLVVVAPTLETGGTETATSSDPDLNGPPDLRGLRAFVAAGHQAVTYAAGTWHAPMVALGPPGSAVDFVVAQCANDVPVEDCQEVAFGDGGRGEGEGGIWVRVPAGREAARL